MFIADTISSEQNNGIILYVGGTGPGNYTTIQDAIDVSSDGDIIFVYSGEYHERLNIDKEIQLIGEKPDDTKINGGRNDRVIVVNADHVSISGFTICCSGTGYDDETIYDLDAGIVVLSRNVTISHNIFLNNVMGILLYETGYNIIDSNQFLSTGGCVYNYDATHTTITNNSFTSTSLGILTGETSYDIIKNNILDDVKLFGIRIWNCTYADIGFNNVTGSSGFGILSSDSYHNEIHNNSISITESNSFNSFLFEKSHNNTIQGNYVYDSRWDGMIFFSSSNDNIIQANTLINNHNSGLVIAYSSGNLVAHNNIIQTNGHSVNIYGKSMHNQIMGNIITGLVDQETGSLDSGVNIDRDSPNNEIIGNTITNHSLHGIHLYSDNNLIQSNTIRENEHDGIYLDTSSNNSIKKNRIINNNNGIHLDEFSYLNDVSKNEISENKDHGIFIESPSENNTFSNNNFIDNGFNVEIESTGNIWKRNYWAGPRILPYKIVDEMGNYDIDRFPRIFPAIIRDNYPLS